MNQIHAFKKKIIVLLVSSAALLLTYSAQASCNSAVSTVGPLTPGSCGGTTSTIGIVYTQRAQLNSIEAYGRYTINMPVAGSSWISVYNASNVLVAQGSPPLTFDAGNSTGTFYAHVNNGNTCYGTWVVGNSMTMSLTRNNPSTPSTPSVTSSCTGYTLSGFNNGSRYDVQGSPDNATWTSLSTNQTGTTYSIASSETRSYFQVRASYGSCAASWSGSAFAPSMSSSSSLTISSNISMGGTYNLCATCDFTVNSGVTITEVSGCPLTINARNITMAGTINGDGAGSSGGSGGGGGGSSGGAGGGSQASGGGGGGAGGGTGGGGAGTTGNSASGGNSINCGTVCASGSNARRAGAAGGSGGAGGSHGGAGGSGTYSAAGRTSDNGGTTAGAYVTGPGVAATYDNASNTADLNIGSGGSGGGGGGGGFGGGGSGSSGGAGGGAVNLNATNTLSFSGAISVNGTGGGVGGDGGSRSGNSGAWNCSTCSDPCGGGANACRNSDLCGTCCYYTWSASGGGGAGAGGGSGGGIKLQAFNNMTATGSLSANGGSGGNAGRPWQDVDGSCNDYAGGGAGGGGGVIKMVINPCASNNINPSSISYTGGGAGRSGLSSSAFGSSGSIGAYNNAVNHASYTALSAGTITGASTICYNTTPTTALSFSVTPSGGTGSYTYQWYSAPVGTTATSGIGSSPAGGWTSIGTGTSATLATASIGSLTASTIYQCRVTSGTCNAWTGTQQITVYANFNTGAISTDTTICYNAVPYLNITTSPSGAAGTYNYQWYYQTGLASSAPTGTTTTGWTSIPGATSSSYTPSTGLTANTTYSLTIDPTGSPDCASPTWVGSMRRVTVLPNFSTGAISGDTTICYNAVPYLNVTTSPSGANGTFNYQWYYQDGLASTAPTGTSTTGWTLIAGATSSSYTPSTGITANRTYSLTIDPTGTPDCISPTWVGSMRRVTVLANFSTGAISGDTTICYNAVPYLNVTTSPSGAAGTYNYQWYYQDGLASAAPTGTSTSGWTSIPGATSRSYTPSSGITANRTYSLTIDPTGTPDCISPTWVGSMRRVTVLPNYSTGAISGDTTICYNAVPYLNVTTSPSGATGTYNYQWYYQDGLASTAPTGTSTSGWTVIAGATSSSYTPSSGITANRTYSLTIDPTGTPDCISPTWVGSMRRVTVLPNFSTGAISGDTTICYNAVPYLNVTTSPSGANGTFNYQWYYQDGLASTAPTGTSTTGWTLVAGATSSSYTPSTGITANRTYSLTIDPTGTPDCISPTWVGSMRRVTVLANFSTGAISGDTTICYNAVPYLNVTTSPSGAAGTYNYQWYYQDGIVSVAPTGTSTTGWTLIPGATSTSYTPSTGLTASRTYSLTIDPTGTPDCISPTWVGSSRRVTVLSNFTTGSITSADEHICISGDPSNITMSSAPSGASGTYNYQWYYKDGLITAPTGTSTTGWTSISSATSSSYDPPSGLSVNRTYAVTVDPTGTPDCIAPTWTGTARQVTIDSTSVGGTLTGGTSPICIGADPGAMTLTGYRGAVNNWNVSYNGAGFSTIASTATSYDPGALTPNGRYAYKVTVQNGVCPSTTSTIDTIIVNPTPVGGTAASTSTVICSGDSTTAVVSGYTGVIQWQVSTVSPFTVYNDISGATSSSYNTGALTATGSSIVQRKYRAKLTNPGCGSTDYSLPVTISIYPPSNGGTVTPSQLVCYNYNPADISVSGYVGTINRWEWSTNSSFTSPTTVSSTLATLSGTSIGSLTANRYYRAIVQNGVCTETPSSSPAYIRVNNPDNLGNSSSVGSCTVDGTGGWINIFDSSNKLIASVNGNGNNLGTVTVNSYVRSAPGFINDSHVHDAVHDINCAGTPQAYMNRSYKFSTSNPLSSGTALVRLYFTDAELAALIDSSISSAATYPAVSTIASDPSGCADDDDVQNINQLYITQYSGVSEDNDYSNNSSNPSDYTVHKPVALGGTLANSGTGNANYGANYVEATLTRFSEFWLDGSQHGVPLPVKLVKLDATNMNNSYIRVSWTTEIEVNNAGFDVLRSTDGKTFTKVGSIKGNGNTTQISNYFFDDHEVVANTVYYYQLKQIDMDGKSELSYIVSSEIKPIDRSAVIGDFVPNPADNLTHIEITAYKAEKISVSVYNMIGEWMFSYDKEVAPGANKLTFSTDNLSSGTYFVKFSSDNQNLSKKLVVTR